ncbi:AAEL005034-PA [Aedes aegypti]|uniref:Globin domain-containing protein n=2 Tax=Aedes aegypti TaxID=7159 RepID=Q17B93_AEDAE|nr:myoglobin [Aedes aegypti]EAT43553.1 AAEL005034-PA [Aedes aegypti]
MDESGLTGKQKITLLSAWGLLKQESSLHGRNMMFLLFREHPRYLPYFDFSSDSTNSNLADNKSFHLHAVNVMGAIGTLIECGLNDPEVFRKKLFHLVEVHKARGVTPLDVQLFSEIITDYLVEVLGRQAANSLADALGKLFDQFAEAFAYQD